MRCREDVNVGSLVVVIIHIVCYHRVGDPSLPIKDGSFLFLFLFLSSGDDVWVEMHSLGWF